jgi:hypothetical protein
MRALGRSLSIAAALAFALVFASSAPAAVITNERTDWSEEDYYLGECGTTYVSFDGVRHEVSRDNGSHVNLIAHGEDTDGARWVIIVVINQLERGTHVQIRWIRQGNDYPEDDWNAGGPFTGCR